VEDALFIFFVIAALKHLTRRGREDFAVLKDALQRVRGNLGSPLGLENAEKIYLHDDGRAVFYEILYFGGEQRRFRVSISGRMIGCIVNRRELQENPYNPTLVREWASA
jgi:hypothetical protein